MQLTKLKAATAAQISACHQRSLNVSSNSARVNSQNTTTLPVDSAISRRMRCRDRRRRADRRGHGMRRRAQRESARPAARRARAKTAKQRRCQHQQQRHGGAAQGDVDGGKRSSDRARSRGHPRIINLMRIAAWFNLRGQPFHVAATSPSAQWSCRTINFAILPPPNRRATLLDGSLLASMQWMISSDLESRERPSRSTPAPLRPRSPCHGMRGAMPQPTSNPGQPGGYHGPTRPTNGRLIFSSTTNMPKPCSAQCPAITAALRQPPSRW